MAQILDCVVAGSCVVDLLCRPVQFDQPIRGGVLYPVEPLLITAGGITSNAGVTMARLGLRIGILTYVGNDGWAPVLRDIFRKEGIDDSPVLTHPTGATSTTVVAIDPSGERSFFHCVGAPKLMNGRTLLDQMDLFRRTRLLLLGYYSLMPNLEPELAQAFREIRAVGCQTALDSAGDGGGMQPLAEILPHLDVWVPSLNEAKHQTGHDDPRKIVETYRSCGAPGLLGVKLGGTRGVLLSPRAGEFVEVRSVQAPGAVVDTTGAGDCFLAGLCAGLLRGLPVAEAGKIGAAAAACCVTALGGSTGGRGWDETARLAGV